jgi:DNA-binding SARP family transcriptional activator
LARKLAPRVFVDDLGSVEVLIGGTPLQRGIRRKVLGLLCFLTSRQGMAATKDEALEALWPELGPDTAANSLHQTIYFLRRVFEPDYKEGLSAGYVLFDGEVVSLDPDLVDSASRGSWRLISQLRAGDHEEAWRLLRMYRGKYALDFSYEDWAASYREHLHAAVLGIVEAEMLLCAESGRNDSAIGMAHAVLAIDPAADAIELALLRAYKRSGKPAAAAEQYAHYAAVVREELGAEAPLFDEI